MLCMCILHGNSLCRQSIKVQVWGGRTYRCSGTYRSCRFCCLRVQCFAHNVAAACCKPRHGGAAEFDTKLSAASCRALGHICGTQHQQHVHIPSMGRSTASVKGPVLGRCMHDPRWCVSACVHNSELHNSSEAYWMEVEAWLKARHQFRDLCREDAFLTFVALQIIAL